MLGIRASKTTWVLISFAVVFAVSWVPSFGVTILAPLAALLVGAVAVRSTNLTTQGAAMAAGAVVGIGALAATVLVFALFGYGWGLDPSIQEMVRSSEPHPEAQIPYDWIAPLGAAMGGFLGIGVGLIHVVLSTLGGALAALTNSRRTVVPST